MFGAAAMSLSMLCVVSNALRLNLFDLHSTKHDRKPKSAALPAAPVQPAAAENTAEPVSAPVVKEDNAMKKTLHVEGMMCGHCEARVKKALEALPAVDEAVVSHEAGTAIVTLNAEVSDADLKKAVEDQDYKVTGIEITDAQKQRPVSHCGRQGAAAFSGFFGDWDHTQLRMLLCSDSYCFSAMACW